MLFKCFYGKSTGQFYQYLACLYYSIVVQINEIGRKAQHHQPYLSVKKFALNSDKKNIFIGDGPSNARFRSTCKKPLL